MSEPAPSVTPEDARFLAVALRERYSIGRGARVLDFGCGRGLLVELLVQLGFDAWGCDNAIWRSGDYEPNERLRLIFPSPYRLPFDDNSFDAVVSTSVLEHALNKEDAFREMHRILKPGGVMLHAFPSKWYLPTEPHIFVPFISWLWPNVPTWWLTVWALLGVRNSHQQGLAWRDVVKANRHYCDTGIHYWSLSEYRRALMPIFGGFDLLDRFYLEHASGGAAALGRRLPAAAVVAWLIGRTRMTMLGARRS